MAHEEFEQNLALYAIDALDQPDIQALEAHLAEGCQLCLTALREYRETTGLLPHGLPVTAPPPDLKDRIEAAALAEVLAQQTGMDPNATLRTADGDVTIQTSGPPVAVPAGDVTVRRPHRPASVPDAEATVRLTSQEAARLASRTKAVSPLPSWLAWMRVPAFTAVTLGFAIGLAAYSMLLRSEIATEIAQRQDLETLLQQTLSGAQILQRQAGQQARELAALRQQSTAALAQRDAQIQSLHGQLTQRDELLAFLQSANVKVVSLVGSDKAKAAAGVLLYDPATKKAFFYAFNMPPLAHGKTYQLWAIVDKPVNAGVFGVDTGRKGRLVTQSLPELPRIKQFAVSIEPEGGRPQPSGAIYLASRR